MIRRFYIPVILLPLSAQSFPTLPHELPQIEKMADDLRAPVTRKIGDLQKTYSLWEKSPGVIEYRTKDLKVVAHASYLARSWDHSRKLIETISLRRSDERILMKEVVYTEGAELHPREPMERLLFQGSAGAELLAGENFKRIQVFVDDRELYQIQTQRLNGGRQTKLYLGGELVLIQSLLSHPSSNVARFRVEQIQGKYFIHFFGYHGSHRVRGTEFRTDIVRQEGFYLESLEYFLKGTDTVSQIRFLEEFDRRTYRPLFASGLLRAIHSLVDNHFPATRKIQTVGKTNRFLEDLKLTRVFTQRAKTDPSQLQRVERDLTLYINAIEAGEIRINDLRR